MKNTFKEILSNINIDNEYEDALLEISEKVFIDEPIEKIKEKATEEAFNLFIGSQLIGCYKSDGWAMGIFGNFPEIVPYAPSVLEKIGLNEVSKKVLEIINIFPKWTDFSNNNQDYCDVINFLEGNESFIENEEKFKIYSDSEKISIIEEYEDLIEDIEILTEKLWGYDSPDKEGWGVLINYLKHNINSKVWK